MSTSFFSQSINFKISGLIVILDNLTIYNNPNTKWARFSGTPCSWFEDDLNLNLNLYLKTKTLNVKTTSNMKTVMTMQRPQIRRWPQILTWPQILRWLQIWKLTQVPNQTYKTMTTILNLLKHTKSSKPNPLDITFHGNESKLAKI